MTVEQIVDFIRTFGIEAIIILAIAWFFNAKIWPWIIEKDKLREQAIVSEHTKLEVTTDKFLIALAQCNKDREQTNNKFIAELNKRDDANIAMATNIENLTVAIEKINNKIDQYLARDNKL